MAELCAGNSILLRVYHQKHCNLQRASRLIAVPLWERGKSGQHRAPYFLTGRGHSGDGRLQPVPQKIYRLDLQGRGKGEKVG